MESTNTQLAWTQVAEVELVYKTKVKLSERPKVQSSSDMHGLFLQLWNKDLIELQEEFKVLLLNRSNKVLGVYPASSGGITGTVADPRLILIAALKAGACSLILSHNHPSGCVKPSRADVELTYKIKEAAKYLEIHLIDHIIVSLENYYSFADEGLL